MLIHIFHVEYDRCFKSDEQERKVNFQSQQMIQNFRQLLVK